MNFHFLWIIKRLPVFFTLKTGVVPKGVWIGVRFHACADCAQFHVDLFIVGFELMVVKKGPNFDENMAQWLADHRE